MNMAYMNPTELNFGLIQAKSPSNLQLKFEYDKSIAHGSELSALIQKARSKDNENQSEEE